MPERYCSFFHDDDSPTTPRREAVVILTATDATGTVLDQTALCRECLEEHREAIEDDLQLTLGDVRD